MLLSDIAIIMDSRPIDIDIPIDIPIDNQVKNVMYTMV